MRKPRILFLAVPAILAACQPDSDPVASVPPPPPPPARQAALLTATVASVGPVFGQGHVLTIDGTAPVWVGAAGQATWVVFEDEEKVIEVRPAVGCDVPERRRVATHRDSVHFDLECEGWGTAFVTAPTTGTLSGPGAGNFMVFVDGGWDWPAAFLRANDTTTLILATGIHQVDLTAPGCFVQEVAGHSIDIAVGDTIDLSFSVFC